MKLRQMRIVGGVLILLVTTMGRAAAIDVTLNADDALGETSFNAALHWNNGLAPAAGNDYFTSNFRLRTPADGESHTFAGDSLTINNTNGYSWGLMYKGTGNTSVITIPNLILDGGQISHANGVGDLFQLDGSITVNSPSEIYAKQGNIDILADISGPAGLAILQTDAPTDVVNRFVTLFGNSTLAGNIDVSGKLRLADAGSMLFDIGPSGVNNAVLGSGIAAFNGTFNFDLTGASSAPGDSWTIAGVTTQTFGETFAVGGSFARSGDFWSDGTYLFNPLDGTLSVSALPISWNVDGGGNWGVGANWTGGNVPSAGSDVIFGGVLTAPNAPATVSLNVPVNVGQATFSNPNTYIIDGPQTLTLTGLAQLSATSGVHEVSATIAGAAGLTKTGSGQIALSGNNTYTGLTDVQGGVLGVRNVNSINGNVNVETGAALHFQGDELGGGYNGTFAGGISGAGQVVLSDSLTTETVTFNSAKAYSGQTNIVGGTLAISNSGALGVADGTVASRTLISGNEATGTLALTGNIAVGNELLAIGAREGDGADTVQLRSTGNNSWAGNVKGELGGTQYNFESVSGTLTLSGIISAPDSAVRNLVFDGAGNYNITGRITDLGTDAEGNIPLNPANNTSSVNVFKRGSGTLTVRTGTSSQDDFWQGNTVIEEGTLEVISMGGVDGELWSPTIDIRSGATLDVDNFTTYSLQIGQNIQGGGTIQATGTTVSIFDDNSVTPGDGVGTLAINGNVSLIGDAGGGTLRYELGAITTPGAGVNDLLQISGALSVVGTPTMTVAVTPVAADLASGTYRLVSHAGGTVAVGGLTPQVVDANGNPLTIRQGLSITSAPGQVNLSVSGNEAALVWAGSPGNAWNVNAAANWSGGQTFFDLDDVTFNDVAGANDTVDISTTNVAPGAVTVNSNTGNTYTFTGTNGMVGPGSMALTGNATAVLANTSNNLSGAVTLAAGTTLQQGNGISTGATVLSGNVSGAGALRVSSGSLTLSGDNAYTGVTTVTGGTLLIDSATALGATSGNTVISGGTLRSNGDDFTVNEPLLLNGGTVAVGGGAGAALVLGGPITVGNAGGSFQVDGGGGDDALTVTSNITGAAAGPLNMNVDGGSTMTVAANVSTSGPLNKNGGGVLALSAATVVSSPLINVNTGTLDVTAQGTFNVANTQTLSGNDGGVVLGNVSASTGGTIRVGSDGLAQVPVFEYVDATFGAAGNTTLADGSTLIPGTNPQWQERTALANLGNVLQGGSDTPNPNEAPVIKTSIGGLTPGEDYTVYVNYWDATGSSWRILAGPAEDNLTLFDSPADAVAGATDGIDLNTLTYVVTPLITEGNRTMWGGALGTFTANASGQIEVFVDDTGTTDGDDRTWYDGVTISTGATTGISEIMTIDGDLTMNAGSLLAIDIATPDVSDLLSITGSLQAGGTLAVSLDTSAPSPALGDVFDILDFASASGAFSTLSLPGLGGGLTWDASNLLTTGELSVIMAGGGTPGDFNADGDVDGFDFLLWQRNPAVGALADWEANFGTSGPLALAASGVVPEPTTGLLLASGALLAASSLRRKL
jgi:autotransporter-associated beta strand protein